MQDAASELDVSLTLLSTSNPCNSSMPRAAIIQRYSSMDITTLRTFGGFFSSSLILSYTKSLLANTNLLIQMTTAEVVMKLDLE
jgi:hypothetical protein